MKILLSFTGFHDPFSESVIEKRRQAGPVLSMLEAKQFDGLILFNTPGTAPNTADTLEAVKKAFPAVAVDVKELKSLYDPTDHVAILRYLRGFVPDILESHPGAEFFISIASGTPSMHACWLLIVADGTIPAGILYGHPPRDATQTYRVTEIDLSADEFPEISPRELHPPKQDEAYEPELAALCEELQIVGSDRVFVTALDRAVRLAKYDCHILLVGETGTGKEQLARLIHRASGRPADRFVAVNCASIPKELAESILFGHERGAFTGASQRQEGEFSRAHGGTLFLDEIAEMSSVIQAKLLRVLQDGKIKPLGGVEKTVDVRVIAATNMNLAKAMRDQKFRADLAQRFLDTIELPPLRRRRADIVKLATFALTRWNRTHGEKRSIGRSALDAMQAYPWPGNVRELISAIERAAMLAKRQSIRADDLSLGEAAWVSGCRDLVLPEPEVGFSLSDYLSETRATLIERAIASSGGNHAQAARKLGITPQAVHKFVKTRENENNVG
jgi:DNA-binding NtrC family response regulator